MADPAEDVQVADISPDDFDGEDSKPSAAPSVAPKDPVEAKDAKDPAKGDDTPAPSDAPPDGEEDDATPSGEADPDKPEDKPKGAEKRIDGLQGEIRDLVSQRNSLRDEVSKLTGEAYQVATEGDLAEQTNPETGEPFTSIEAKVESMRQQQAMDKYNAEVAEKQFVLGQESYKVLTDFPIFNPDSDTFDEELASEAADLLDANLIRDPNVPELDAEGKQTGKGLIIGSNVSPYKLYQTLARASGISAVKGRIEGQADAGKQLANADAPSSASPPKPKVDPVIALWEADD